MHYWIWWAEYYVHAIQFSRRRCILNTFLRVANPFTIDALVKVCLRIATFTQKTSLEFPQVVKVPYFDNNKEPKASSSAKFWKQWAHLKDVSNVVIMF